MRRLFACNDISVSAARAYAVLSASCCREMVATDVVDLLPRLFNRLLNLRLDEAELIAGGTSTEECSGRKLCPRQ